MRILVFTLMGGLVLTALPATTHAQRVDPRVPSEGHALDPTDVRQFRGEVIGIEPDGRKLTVRGPQGVEHTFEVIPNAQIIGEQDHRDFEALRVGQQVSVRTLAPRTNRLEAEIVEILDMEATPEGSEAAVSAGPSGAVLEGGAQATATAPLDVADTVTVTSIDVEGRRFTAGDRTFRVDDGTLILRGPETVTLTRLRTGDRVVVSVREEGTQGPARAERVQIVIDPHHPAKPATP